MQGSWEADRRIILVERFNQTTSPTELRRCRSIIGSLIYLAVRARPDIAVTVSTLGTLGEKRCEQHLKGEASVAVCKGYNQTHLKTTS